MDATVTLEKGMTFRGTADSGFTITMGAHPSVGGDDDGPRPLELLLIGLGGCTVQTREATLLQNAYHECQYQQQVELRWRQRKDHHADSIGAAAQYEFFHHQLGHVQAVFRFEIHGGHGRGNIEGQDDVDPVGGCFTVGFALLGPGQPNSSEPKPSR